jgi:hypothetical protein
MTNGGDEDSGAISSNTSSVPHPSLRNSSDRWYEIPIADQLRKNLGMSKMLNIKKIRSTHLEYKGFMLCNLQITSKMFEQLVAESHKI